MVLVREELHDLKDGDHFAFESGGPVYIVDESNFIDYWGARLIMYQTTTGLHGHIADHTVIWLIVL